MGNIYTFVETRLRLLTLKMTVREVEREREVLLLTLGCSAERARPGSSRSMNV